MPDLPTRPDLDQLRTQAKDLLGAAKAREADAVARIERVSERLTLASAQLALAREYGFASWSKLKMEVERRRILDDRDLSGLRALLADSPDLATMTMEHWCDHPLGAPPLSYVAMLRYDTSRFRWRNVTGTAEMARALVAAGAPVDGQPGDPEPPLVTAASYGDAQVALVLLEAGADIDMRSGPDAGGVPGGSALVHAAVFGMTEVVDVLIGAGARVDDLETAAAAGDITGWLTANTPHDSKVRALVMAADHQRLDVIEQLVSAGTPVDAEDPEFGRHPLRTAAGHGRTVSVQRLLQLGADPNLRDSDGRTPLDLCRAARYASSDPESHEQIEAILRPITS